MTYITGHDRSQLLLLPEAVDDYVGLDNPVRFIDAIDMARDIRKAAFQHGLLEFCTRVGPSRLPGSFPRC